MSIIQKIEEQCSFNFTGRINILKQADRQFLGVVYINEGEIVAAQFSQKTGIKALYSLVIFDMDGIENFTLVAEPEVVSDSDFEFKLKFSEFKKNAEKAYQEHRQSLSLRPPADIHILINPAFIKVGKKTGANEFLLLKTIAEYSKVNDIYTNCELFDFEVTQALVSLRRLGALKVVK
ncbi:MULTISPECIES: hypothetical protein [Halobacteriovorax]|uniref:DUF4388 domain-containing protein n=1 Tax=Halobacteriovorax vibrionivorans TaxID=2152716 RepID=A0ABY0IMA2_9BACT|nr:MULTISPECIES: hypothetical protein [Halobacteriovorax]AYF45985.1 hypothetical protein BALOs_3003 [Halobacteriovorax sp. BALOs_7]RZF23011.1 hypothetical protein DAY19_04365 [Halobacteriovorax vibrionivorans]TGD45698.1 hypothetical protein EP118_14910 [Halobacteriovorax sp. Y22]